MLGDGVAEYFSSALAMRILRGAIVPCGDSGLCFRAPRGWKIFHRQTLFIPSSPVTLGDHPISILPIDAHTMNPGQPRTSQRRQSLRMKIQAIEERITTKSDSSGDSDDDSPVGDHDHLGPRRMEIRESRGALEELMAECQFADEDRPVLSSLAFLPSTSASRVRLDPASKKNQDYVIYRELLNDLQTRLDQVDDFDDASLKRGVGKVQGAIDHLNASLQRRIEEVYDTRANVRQGQHTGSQASVIDTRASSFRSCTSVKLTRSFKAHTSPSYRSIALPISPAGFL